MDIYFSFLINYLFKMPFSQYQRQAKTCPTLTKQKTSLAEFLLLLWIFNLVVYSQEVIAHAVSMETTRVLQTCRREGAVNLLKEMQ